MLPVFDCYRAASILKLYAVLFVKSFKLALGNVRIQSAQIFKQSRLVIERLAKCRFGVSGFSSTFRNSKWANYVKSNMYAIKLNSLFLPQSPLSVLVLIITIAQVVTGTLVLFQFCSHAVDFLIFLFYASSPWFHSLATRCANYAVTWYTGAAGSIRIFKNNPSYKVETCTAANADLLSSEPSSKCGVTFIRSAYTLSTAFGRLNDQRCVTSLRRILRSDLKTDWVTAGTSMNSALWVLKVWTEAERGVADNRRRSSTGRSCDAANPLRGYWELETVLASLRTDTTLLEMLHTNENLKNRNLLPLRSLCALTPTLRELTTLTEVRRWLYKYSMLQNKSVVSALNVVSARRLTSLNAYTFDKDAGNIWVANLSRQSTNLKGEFLTPFGNTNSAYAGLWSVGDMFFKNSFSTAQNPLFTFNKHQELSYYWFLKRLFFVNANHSFSLKLAPLLNVQRSEMLTDVFLPYLDNQDLTKLLCTLKVVGKCHAYESLSALAKDAFYRPSEAAVLGQDTLLLLYSLSSTETGVGLSSPYHQLRVFYGAHPPFTKLAKSDLLMLLKSQPSLALAGSDLINKENLKNTYRCTLFTNVKS